MTSLAALKSAAPLPLVAGEYVKLRKSSRNYLALCLWHQEKNPSLRIYDDHYYCFTCQAHGDVIDFVARAQGVSKGTAIRILSERTGVSVTKQPHRSRLQCAHHADEQAFAEWWHRQQRERLAARCSLLSEYWAALGECDQEDPFWKAAVEAGRILRQFSAANPRILAERCATEDDRREWDWLQSLPHLFSKCEPAPTDSILADNISLPSEAHATSEEHAAHR